MGYHYKIHEGKAHFVTLIVVDWIDVFTRENLLNLNLHEYLFSSARNYAGMDGLMDVILIDPVAL